MSARIPLFLLLVVTSLAATALAQNARIRCPAGASYHRTRGVADKLTLTTYGQYEEYCLKRGATGAAIRVGPYRLWGPNGEKLESGQYRLGRRDGKWARWIPTQILEDTWKDGKFIDAAVMGYPAIYTIDFAACIPHEYGVAAALGSTLYRLTGKQDGACQMTYSREIEMGEGPTVTCRVPVAKGKLLFSNTQMGLDFSSLGAFCK